MMLPAWLQNDSAWIALGVSLVIVVAALVMHRVVVKVLRAPASQPTTKAIPPKENSPHE